MLALLLEDQRNDTTSSHTTQAVLSYCAKRDSLIARLRAEVEG